jgi:hypothetical protein
MLWSLAKQADNACVELPFPHQVEFEILQLRTAWKPAKPEEEAYFLKIRMVGQFMDVDAAIGSTP